MCAMRRWWMRSFVPRGGGGDGVTPLLVSLARAIDWKLRWLHRIVLCLPTRFPLIRASLIAY